MDKLASRARLHAAVFLAIAATLGTGDALAQRPRHAPSETAALAGQHPAAYYRAAATLFGRGRKDDAVFLFYLGQLRYRTHLAARRATLKPDADPALFASLSEVVGRPINEYAFGDIPELAGAIEAVLAYDAANPDSFTPPRAYAAASKSVRAGLASMKSALLQQADRIRAERTKNGLENRR